MPAYIITAVLLALVYIWLFMPWNTVDSDVHFTASYRYSNIILGWPEWSARASDAEVIEEYHYQYVYGDCYDRTSMKESFEWFCSDGSCVGYPHPAEYMIFYNPVNYIPFIAGITAARLINLGTVPMLYLARIFAAAVYITLFAHAIKTTSSGKGIFAFVTLLPMTLQLTGAYTYDSAVLVCALNFFACVLRSKDEGLLSNKKHFIELLVWCVLLGLIKGGGYAVLLLLLFSFTGKRRSRENFAVVSLIAACLLAILLSDVVLNPAESYFQLGGADAEKMTTSYMWEHPLGYLQLWLNTIKEYWFVFYIQALGSNLGWSVLITSIVPILLFMPVAITGIGVAENKTYNITNDKKLVAWVLITFFVLLYITPGMVLKDNYVGTDVIMFCLGRYFLPLLPLLLILISDSIKRKVTVKVPVKVCSTCAGSFVIMTVVVVYLLIRIFVMGIV